LRLQKELLLLTVDENKLDSRRDNLYEGDWSPRPIVVDTGRSPSYARDYQGTQVPQAVVNCCYRTTVLGMANFSEEKRRTHLGETVTETKKESTSDEHYMLVRN
jgi:hypothetical protein